MTALLHDTWDEIRARVLARDDARCTVSRLLGGECFGRLHVHHIVPREEGGPDEEDNLATVCAHHHPIWEALRRKLRQHRGWRPCPHPPGAHRYEGAREACERLLNRPTLVR